MTDADKKDFFSLMAVVAGYYDKTPSVDTATIYWNGLKSLPFATVKDLFNLHLQSSVYMPKISEILNAAVQMDGRPDAEEAWSMHSVCLNDEGPMIVVTDEMLSAFGVALNLQNDRIAARMAYKEKYQSEVTAARRSGKPVRWSISPGTDKTSYESKLIEAVKLGRLPAEYALKQLPYNASTDSREKMIKLESEQKLLEKKEEQTMLVNQ